MRKPKEPPNETPFERMERMTKALIAVPKTEVDKLKKRQQRAIVRRDGR